MLDFANLTPFRPPGDLEDPALDGDGIPALTFRCVDVLSARI
jgi:hypothetical protein